jgi:hypothetical protein
MYLWSYNQNSEGAANLCKELAIPRLKHRNSKFVGNPNKTVINWGSTEPPPEVMKCMVLNHPENVAKASNKLAAFKRLQDDDDACEYLPEFTTDLQQAKRWLMIGHCVVARKVLNGHSGAGIVIMDPKDPDTHEVQAPLYVVYKKKKHEFRVHVMRDKFGGHQVVDIQRKGLRAEYQGRDDVNWKVRNLANGFIYAREGFETPNRVTKAALHAVRALGLDFGAVDIIYQERNESAYILEVNTAPGITGTTVLNYANAFRNLGAI